MGRHFHPPVQHLVPHAFAWNFRGCAPYFSPGTITVGVKTPSYVASHCGPSEEHDHPNLSPDRKSLFIVLKGISRALCELPSLRQTPPATVNLYAPRLRHSALINSMIPADTLTPARIGNHRLRLHTAVWRRSIIRPPPRRLPNFKMPKLRRVPWKTTHQAHPTLNFRHWRS